MTHPISAFRFLAEKEINNSRIFLNLFTINLIIHVFQMLEAARSTFSVSFSYKYNPFQKLIASLKLFHFSSDFDGVKSKKMRHNKTRVFNSAEFLYRLQLERYLLKTTCQNSFVGKRTQNSCPISFRFRSAYLHYHH